MTSDVIYCFCPNDLRSVYKTCHVLSVMCVTYIQIESQRYLHAILLSLKHKYLGLMVFKLQQGALSLVSATTSELCILEHAMPCIIIFCAFRLFPSIPVHELLASFPISLPYKNTFLLEMALYLEQELVSCSAPCN